MLPGDVVRRLKIEAMEAGTIPALIVLDALDRCWQGSNGASDPTTIAKYPEKREYLTRLLQHLEALVSDGKLTVAEIASAAGVKADEITMSWRTAGYVPAVSGGAVGILLQSKRLPLNKKKP
jgi:hypothetical protein